MAWQHVECVRICGSRGVAERGGVEEEHSRLPRKALPGHASCAATEGPGQALSFVVLVQSLSCVWPLMTPWTVGHQSSLSFTISQSLFRFMSIGSVMPSNHLIFCCHLLLLPSIFSSIRVFSNGSSHQVAKVLELQLQHQSLKWIFRVDFL